MELLEYAADVVSRALSNGGDMAEIYLEEKKQTSLRVEAGQIERVSSGTDMGAGIRLLCGDLTLYAHTNDVSLSGLIKAADAVASGVSAERANYRLDYSPQVFSMPVRERPQDVPTEVKARLALGADRAARGFNPCVSQVRVVYADSLRRVTIVNSNGRYVQDVRPQIMFLVQVVATEKNLMQTGYEPVGGTMGFELFDEHDPETVALAAASQACLMLEAQPAPAGRMPIVISSEAGGTMIHEAVGHGLEADHIDKQMSKYCGRLGEVIAAPEITVIDDGTLPCRRGSGSIDDEGTQTQRTVLIEEGRLVGFMNDLRTARKMGVPPTGNGRRESYQHKPVPRMTNTLIAPGKCDPADIVSSTEKGLFVRKMGGGQVNTLNGDFVFDVSEGYLIEHGRIGAPVRGATLIGNGPEVLMNIEMVGRDLGFGIGTCGKDGQGAPVSDAQPTLRIRELTVGGTSR